MNGLTSNLKESTTQNRNYWVVAPYVDSAHGTPERDQWITLAEKGYVCMGHCKEPNMAPGFYGKMKEGDVVVVAGSSTPERSIFGVGFVGKESECKHCKDYPLEGTPHDEACYRRFSHFITNKEVLKQLEPKNFKYRRAEYRLKNGLDDKSKIDLLNKILLPELASIEDDPFAVAKNLLLENKNLILTGAPGTGKTYSAKKIAEEITGHNKEAVGFVQFHPSYDYTDFVEGLRPTKPDGNGNIGFQLKEGVFKRFCKAAKKDCVYNQEDKYDEEKSKKFVFIIDEINRGEISKIFGELFFSIDPGYRGKKGGVKTQYANMHDNPNEEFYVPENVYIIGTMNDIDHSVESFDFAMRRRFVWKEITAEDSQNMLTEEVIKKMVSQPLEGEQLIKWKGKVIEKMNALNEGISKIEGLNSSYHIGAAYFSQLKPDENGEPNFSKLWNLRLKPLLSEYLRGMPNADEEMQKLEDGFLIKRNGEK
jgi:DNA polymerase III delta prime subunit